MYVPPASGRRPEPGEYVYVDELPEAILKVDPPYPEEARRAGIEGDVLMQVLVLEDGSVGDWRIVQSIPALDEAAVVCIRQWRFKPALSKGVPTAVWVVTPIRFRK
jgi:protein TonB